MPALNESTINDSKDQTNASINNNNAPYGVASLAARVAASHPVLSYTADIFIRQPLVVSYVSPLVSKVDSNLVAAVDKAFDKKKQVEHKVASIRSNAVPLAKAVISNVRSKLPTTVDAKLVSTASSALSLYNGVVDTANAVKAEPVQSVLSTSQAVFDRVLPPLNPSSPTSSSLTFRSVSAHVTDRLQAEASLRKEQLYHRAEPFVNRYQAEIQPNVSLLQQAIVNNVDKIRVSLAHLKDTIKEQSNEKYTAIVNSVPTVPAALQLHLQSLQTQLSALVPASLPLSLDSSIQYVHHLFDEAVHQLSDKSTTVIGQEKMEKIEQQIHKTNQLVRDLVKKVKSLIVLNNVSRGAADSNSDEAVGASKVAEQAEDELKQQPIENQ